MIQSISSTLCEIFPIQPPFNNNQLICLYLTFGGKGEKGGGRGDTEEGKKEKRKRMRRRKKRGRRSRKGEE